MESKSGYENSVNKTIKYICVFRNFFIFIALLFFFLGVSTNTWHEVDVDMKNFDSYHKENYSAHKWRGARYGGSYNINSINYSYQYNGNYYSSSTICICVHIGFREFEFDTRQAYVFPLAPSLAVLKKGPDLLLCVFVMFIAFLFHYFALFLRGHLLKRSEFTNDY